MTLCTKSPSFIAVEIMSSAQPVPSTFYARRGKRWLDVILALAGLIFLSPLLLLVAIGVRLFSHGPALFRQARMGQFEKPFQIFKFRTMKTGCTGLLITAAGDARITPVGSWLRKTKIDELPQLVNILRGDMSFVGPRPEVPRYAALYSQNQKRIFSAKPGITCPFINFDEEELMAGLSDPEHFYVTTLMPAKLEIDLRYCKNIHFTGDLRIIFGTVAQLCARIVTVASPIARNRAQRAVTHSEKPPEVA